MHPQLEAFLGLLEQHTHKYGLEEISSLCPYDPDKTDPAAGVQRYLRRWKGERGTFTLDGEVIGDRPFLSVTYLGKGNSYQGKGRLETHKNELKFMGNDILRGLNWHQLAEGLPRAAAGKK